VYKLKRSLAIIILTQVVILNVAALCSITPIRVQAGTTAEIYLDPASYTAQRIGETFNVTVNIRNLDVSQKLIVAQFRVSYNSTLLDATSVTEGPFMQQFHNTAQAPYTTFINYIEDNLYYGPNVLAGILLIPNSTPNGGQWTNYPYGNGTLATITFKTLYRSTEPSPPASCLLNLTDTLLVGDVPGSDNTTEIPHTDTSATYYAQPIPLPTLSIQPADYGAILLGETFNASININNLDVDSKLIVAQFRVQYDPTLLKAIDAFEGPFMQQFHDSAGLPYTVFIKFIETETLYGPNVLIGILLNPNATGQWPNYPYGNGTLATIEFETITQPSSAESPITSHLMLNDTLLVGDIPNSSDVTEIPQGPSASASYEIQPLTFTCEPAEPLVDQATTFTITEPPNHAPLIYNWDFGDGTQLNTTEPSIGHLYASPGNYNVVLTVILDNDTSSNTSQTITVMPNNKPTPIDVTMDVGSIHFKGETAQFNLLTANNGEPINATKIEASLYYDGNIIADLSSSTQQVTTGYYTISYDVPATAQPGTYTLMVQVEYYNAKGTSLKSFQISPTLTAWNNQMAQITAIHDGIATIQNGLTNLTLNLTAINATLAGLIQNNGQVLATINTSVGTLSTKLDTINATIVSINGNMATVSSTLGNITTKLDGIQSTATMTLYAASILSAIAVVLAAIILIFVRKK
jgi:hypothetical protein